MNPRLLILIYSILSLNSGEIRAQEKPDYLTSLLPKLNHLKIGYSHVFTSSDPKAPFTSTDSEYLRHYKSYEALVGYLKVGDVLCLINTYPGDDIYLILKTYKDGKEISSAQLCFGTSGMAGCELDSNKEEVKLVSANRFENTRILITTDCDEKGNKINGTTKAEKSRRSITIKPNGTITVTESTE